MGQGRASIAKHPLHPMLVVFPIGLWIAALAFDIVLAFWNIIGGIIGALVAAVPGFLDYPGRKVGSGASPPGTWSST